MNDKKSEKKAIIDNFVAQIQHHQNLYYNNTPEISDDAFDALWDTLRSLDPENSILQTVGSDSTGFFPKTKHIIPMGSLDKAAEENEFMRWATDAPASKYIVQHKLDGASLELQYSNGILKAAVTRGNGVIGDNIFINARNMNGVPKNLTTPLTLAVRGEVIMMHEVHKAYFSDKANCRNAANGLMKKKDGIGVEHLCVMCYDLWCTSAQEEQDALQVIGKPPSYDGISEKEKLTILSTLGFTTVKHRICKNAHEVCIYRNDIIKQRDSLAYDIDGLVVKLPYADKKDMLSLRPKKQIAFKFPLDNAITTLVDVEWSESGHLYTPVAILAPVRIAGTTVQRANLVHPDHIRELGIKIGSEVAVVKRGEIIPKVEKAIYTPDAAQEITAPHTCSTCGAAIIHEGTRVYCPNISCKRRVLFRIERWIRIQEIDYWGDALLRRLVLQEGIIQSLGDLYRMSIDTIASLDRVGTQLAKKLYDSLHKNTTVPFENFIASIGIDNVAVLTGEKLVAAGINTWNALQHTTEETLANIAGVGPIIAKNIMGTVMHLQTELEDLLHYIQIPEPADAKSLPCVGQSFCFTGAMTYNGTLLARKELIALVKQAGGTVKTAVTQDLTFLVTADTSSSSSKTKKATEYGVSIISPEAFFKIVKSETYISMST